MTIYKYKYKNCDYISEKLYLNFKEGKVRERKCPKYRNNQKTDFGEKLSMRVYLSKVKY